MRSMITSSNDKKSDSPYMKVFQGGLKSMEINVQWKLRRDFSTFKFHVKKDGVKRLGSGNCFFLIFNRRLTSRVDIMHEMNKPSQMYPCPIRPHNKSEQW